MRASPVILLTAWLLASGCQAPKGYLTILPEGYSGWVRVEFGVQGLPPLQLRDGYRVLSVPEGGLLGTSDALFPSPTTDLTLEARGSALVAVQGPKAGYTLTRTKEAGRVTAFHFFGPPGEAELGPRDAFGDPVPGRTASLLRTEGARSAAP